VNGQCIKYKEAVADLHLDLDFAGMGAEKWTLAKKETVKGGTQSSSNLNEKAVSYLSLKTSSQRAPSEAAISVKTPSSMSSKVSEAQSQRSSVKKENPAFPLKNNLDYPNYERTNASKFVEKQEGSLAQNYYAPSKSQLKQMSTYVADLLRTDRESYERLIEILRFLAGLDVELRQLSALRSVFMKDGKPQL
jgi:hypothetical protein